MSDTKTVHTDHPARHWDRTCPACIAEAATAADGLPEPVAQITRDTSGRLWVWAVSDRPYLDTAVSCDYVYTADQLRTAIDAAVAEARAVPADWADQIEHRLLTWRQRTMNRSGDRLALNDFMGQDSIDDLIDCVCAPLDCGEAGHDEEQP